MSVSDFGMMCCVVSCTTGHASRNMCPIHGDILFSVLVVQASTSEALKYICQKLALYHTYHFMTRVG